MNFFHDLKRNTGAKLILLILVGCVLMAGVDASSWPYPIKAILKMTLFIGLPVLWSHRYPHWPKTDWRLPSHSLRLRLGALALAEIGLLIGLLVVLLPVVDTSLLEEILRANFAGRPLIFLGVTFYIVVINAGLEEWYFRGFAYLRLRQALPKRWALVLSALLFSAYHLALMAGLFPLPLYITFVIGLAGVGAFFGWIDDRFNSLWPSFVIHASANLAMNLVAMHLLGFL
jgi:membrane protease YdiL (CAAX protease family)